MYVNWYFSIFAVFIQVPINHAERIPIWNIGHMVNALWQLDQFLDLGANAIEADIAFDSQGNAVWTYHGYPCDCFRSCKKYASIPNYLNYVRELTAPTSPKFRKDFVLLMLDMKISWMNNGLKYKAGADVAQKIINYLWKGNSQLWILISFPLTTDTDFVIGFKDTLKKNGYSHMESKIGWDISGNEDLDVILREYRRLNITGSVWQGDGITNCLPRTTTRLLKAVEKRDLHPDWDLLSKVYYWTLDKRRTMRTTLRYGIDGIITNFPNRYVEVLSEEEFARTHRLATIEDNPWKKIQRKISPKYSVPIEDIIFECEKTPIDEDKYYSVLLNHYRMNHINHVDTTDA